MPVNWDELADGVNKLKNAAQFDLLAISGADLVAVLLDLTKFSDSSPELAETALSLLFSVSQPHAIVIDAVQKTQLLACKEFSDIFNHCGPALRSLKNQVDLAEVLSFVIQGVICLMRLCIGVDASGRSDAFRGDHLQTYLESVYTLDRPSWHRSSRCSLSFPPRSCSHAFA